MVIPFHDANPARRTPWVTYGLVAANLLIFAVGPAAHDSGVGATAVAQECRLEAFYDHYAAIPRELLHNHALYRVPTGAVVDGHCATGEPWYHKIPALSVLSSMFLHASWLHVLGNMLFLWIFGDNVEDRLGHLPYLGFYVLSGYVAAYGYAVASPGSTEVMIGASGAIAGVLGAYLVLYPRAKVWSIVFVVPLRLRAWILLGFWFVLQWVYSAGYATQSGSVAYVAHVWGFVAGMAVALLIRAFGPAESTNSTTVRRR